MKEKKKKYDVIDVLFDVVGIIAFAGSIWMMYEGANTNDKSFFFQGAFLLIAVLVKSTISNIHRRIDELKEELDELKKEMGK